MWIELNKKQRIAVLEQVASVKGLPTFVVEKDWWVCMILRAIFQSQYSSSIIFKGGTSLSKAYSLINRFSEDIDLIIDRELLGFGELKSKSQIKKLRKTSGGFIINEFREELIAQLKLLNIDCSQYEIKYNAQVDDTSDPNILEIYYHSIVPNKNVYIHQRVLLEIGARSLIEPMEVKEISSLIDAQYASLDFSDLPFDVQVVIPTRTCIEKILLLHEEFSKPINKIRTDRLTRHFYDLDKLMASIYGTMALNDHHLFEVIVEHRKTITPLRDMDYSNHVKGKLRIFPPIEVIVLWEKDYKIMQDNMIIGSSLSWEDLLVRIKEIERLFNGD